MSLCVSLLKVATLKNYASPKTQSQKAALFFDICVDNMNGLGEILRGACIPSLWAVVW
eukprot:m.1306802 g.1306802  ORF g.1306802 m.1306802 type:complete len:58 (-) comp24817_c0_seq6:3836-4009(-)